MGLLSSSKSNTTNEFIDDRENAVQGSGAAATGDNSYSSQRITYVDQGALAAGQATTKDSFNFADAVSGRAFDALEDGLSDSYEFGRDTVGQGFDFAEYGVGELLDFADKSQSRAYSVANDSVAQSGQLLSNLSTPDSERNNQLIYAMVAGLVAVMVFRGK